MKRWKSKFNKNYNDGIVSELDFEKRFDEYDFDEFTDGWDDEKPFRWGPQHGVKPISQNKQ